MGRPGLRQGDHEGGDVEAEATRADADLSYEPRALKAETVLCGMRQILTAGWFGVW